MNIRIYSVHIEAPADRSESQAPEEVGWEGWDVVNVALADDVGAAPEVMARGLEMCKKGPDTVRVREVRFIGEGRT